VKYKIVKVNRAHLEKIRTSFDSLSEQDRIFFDFIQNIRIDELLSKSRFFDVIVALSNKELVGYGHLEKFKQPYKKHVCKLGIFIAEDYRGTALSNKIMEYLIKSARRHKLRKIWLSCNSQNLRAIKLYERFGFVIEGVFFDEELRKNKLNDIISMALYLTEDKSSFIPWSKPAIRSEEVIQLHKVIKSDWFSQGPMTKSFEEELKIRCGAKNAVVMNNGSSALMSVFATMFKPGDRVLFPSFTFVSTLNSATTFGIKPILVDIEPTTGNIDLDKAEKILRENKGKDIMGIVPVDIAGHSVDIKRVYELQDKYNIKIVEDAAEAIGGIAYKRPIGSWGHATIFSFHAAKNITTVEGGAVLTNDEEFGHSLRKFRSHGESSTKFQWDSYGLNLRITDLQAAIGLAQMKKLDAFIKNRNEIVSFYKSELANLLEFQEVKEYVDVHPYMMCIAYADKNKVKEIYDYLLNGDIQARLGWAPLHKQPVFRNLFRQVKLKESEEFSKKVICLPIYNGMKITEAEAVVDRIKGAFRE
jgi:dTDP-4-amino-4,6-dideoxygalactose transaminase/GNAT superfamily N-acetyltransferase